MSFSSKTTISQSPPKMILCMNISSGFQVISRGCVPSKSIDFCYVMKVYNEFNQAFKKVTFNFKDLDSVFWVQNVLHNCFLILFGAFGVGGVL